MLQEENENHRLTPDREKGKGKRLGTQFPQGEPRRPSKETCCFRQSCVGWQEVDTKRVMMMVMVMVLPLIQSTLEFTRGLMAVFTAILGGRFYHPHLREEEADAPGQCGSRRHGYIWKRRRQVLFKPQEGEQAGYRVPQRCLFPLKRTLCSLFTRW